MKRLFSVVSMVALLNLTALAGLGVFAWQKGWLEPERVQGAVSLLREGIPDEDTTTGEPGVAVVSTANERIAISNEVTQIRDAELNRREREIETAWQQLETQQLAFLKEKEALEALRKRNAKEVESRMQQVGQSGWKREFELLGGIKPKLAKDLLRDKDDAEVVKILSELETRKAKKIVEQCKTSEERRWIGRILDQMQERDASQAEALVASKAPDQGA